MSFIRARTSEQILKRKEKIVESALSIYDKNGYGAVNFTAIAKSSGLSRPAIYSYFKNTNDILLYALSQDFININQYLEKSLKETEHLTIEEFTKILYKCLMDHPRMLKMISLNYAVMENGSTDESLFAYKSHIIKTIALINKFIDRFFSSVTKEKRQDFLFMFFSFVLSVYVLTHPSQKQLNALEKNDPNFTFPEISHLSYEGLKAIVKMLEN